MPESCKDRPFTSARSYGDTAAFSVHVLRHSFAAAAAEMGFSELTIAGLLGHSVPGVTARYAHIPDRALLAAADQVSARIAAALDSKAGAKVIEVGNHLAPAIQA
jgi:integrase